MNKLIVVAGIAFVGWFLWQKHEAGTGKVDDASNPAGINPNAYGNN